MNRAKHDKDAVIEALNKAFGIVMAAARMLGVDRATMYRYVERYKLQDEVKWARETLLDAAESVVANILTDPAIYAPHKLPAAKFVLNNKQLGADRGYSEIEAVEFDAREGILIKFEKPELPEHLKNSTIGMVKDAKVIDADPNPLEDTTKPKPSGKIKSKGYSDDA